MSRPLDGVRVLDLSRLLPGPFASLVLADLGAEIIKVEDTTGGDWVRYVPPTAGGVSSAFAALNRDKRSISLNLKHPEGRELLLGLTRTTDILLESFRPGVMQRLGLDYQTLRRINPGLIYCAISGYGHNSPRNQVAGHDLNYMAIAGLAGVTGSDDKIVPLGIQAADIAGGSLYAVIGILAALVERGRTQNGRFVDTSMTDGVAGFGIMLHAQQFMERSLIGPGQDNLAGARVCYRPWRCKDGRYLAVGALEPKFWLALCGAIERPDLAGDGMAVGDRQAAVEAELARVFGSRTRDEWVEVFQQADACVEPILTLEEARKTGHAEARHLFCTETLVDGAELLYQYPNPCLLPGAEPQLPPRPAPGLGEHTRQVLLELGCESADIERLAARGAIRL